MGLIFLAIVIILMIVTEIGKSFLRKIGKKLEPIWIKTKKKLDPIIFGKDENFLEEK